MTKYTVVHMYVICIKWNHIICYYAHEDDIPHSRPLKILIKVTLKLYLKIIISFWSTIRWIWSFFGGIILIHKSRRQNSYVQKFRYRKLWLTLKGYLEHNTQKTTQKRLLNTNTNLSTYNFCRNFIPAEFFKVLITASAYTPFLHMKKYTQTIIVNLHKSSLC